MSIATALKVITNYDILPWMAGHENIDSLQLQLEKAEDVLRMIRQAERRYSTRMEFGLYKQADQSKRAAIRLRQYFNNLIMEEISL